jgi:hypothetical protein
MALEKQVSGIGFAPYRLEKIQVSRVRGLRRFHVTIHGFFENYDFVPTKLSS